MITITEKEYDMLIEYLDAFVDAESENALKEGYLLAGVLQTILAMKGER